MKGLKKQAIRRAAEWRTCKKGSMAGLLAIMARLRGPSGCPWDRKQTKHTLKKFLIEETYEALEAIETGKPEDLREELGDLLLQIIFLSRIAEERGEFDFTDVVHTLSEKLVRRHPHVFRPSREGSNPKDAQEVSGLWGTLKRLEGKYHGRKSVLDGIPLSLPALERARRISQRVSRVGFDWPNIEAVWKKVLEEMSELREAERKSSKKAVEAEFGDLLFSLLNWARFRGISAEDALRKANRKFTRRFGRVEQDLRRMGKTPEESTLEEMDRLWNKAKKRAEQRIKA